VADVSIDDTVFVLDADGPSLLGSRCTDCGAHTFPAQDGCARCTGTAMEPVRLAREGTLWTWTLQGFPPKSPPFTGSLDPFVPFAVGYVELAGQVRVEARLTEPDPERLTIGMPVVLVADPLTTDDEGNRVMTFAFQPNGGTA
jgi:uncharacterized OB-fold protein